MKIYPRVLWTARRAGGLFFGLRFSFPVRCIMDDGVEADIANLLVGLVFITVDIEFRRAAIDKARGE